MAKNKEILHRQALKLFLFTWHQWSEIRWKCFFIPENTSPSFSSSITASPLFLEAYLDGREIQRKNSTFLLSNVTDWEQWWEVKCVFWSLTTETTLKCHQTIEAAWAGCHGYAPILALFMTTLCLQGSKAMSVCPVCGCAFKYAAFFPLLLKLVCYKIVLDHICFATDSLEV